MLSTRTKKTEGKEKGKKNSSIQWVNMSASKSWRSPFRHNFRISYDHDAWYVEVISYQSNGFKSSFCTRISEHHANAVQMSLDLINVKVSSQFSSTGRSLSLLKCTTVSPQILIRVTVYIYTSSAISAAECYGHYQKPPIFIHPWHTRTHTHMVHRSVYHARVCMCVCMYLLPLR